MCFSSVRSSLYRDVHHHSVVVGLVIKYAAGVSSEICSDGTEEKRLARSQSASCIM